MYYVLYSRHHPYICLPRHYLFTSPLLHPLSPQFLKKISGPKLLLVLIYVTPEPFFCRGSLFFTYISVVVLFLDRARILLQRSFDLLELFSFFFFFKKKI